MKIDRTLIHFSRFRCRRRRRILRSLLFRLVLTLETSEVSAIFVVTTKTTQPRPQVFSVSTLTCKEAALLTSSVD